MRKSHTLFFFCIIFFVVSCTKSTDSSDSFIGSIWYGTNEYISLYHNLEFLDGGKVIYYFTNEAGDPTGEAVQGTYQKKGEVITFSGCKNSIYSRSNFSPYEMISATILSDDVMNVLVSTRGSIDECNPVVLKRR